MLFFFKLELHYQILIAIFLGSLFGVLLPEYALFLDPLGVLFIRLLKMIMVPLVLSSLVVGVTSLVNLKEVGQIGFKALIYFFLSTFLAITVGSSIVFFMKPGFSSTIKMPASIEPNLNSEGSFLHDFVETVVPENILAALVEGNMLSVILISVLIGLVLLKLGDRTRNIVNLFDGLNQVMLVLTNWIMKCAPIGVFALMAVVLAKLGVGAIKSLAFYIICVFIGLIIQFFLVSPILMQLIVDYSPIKLVRKMVLALSTVFSTSSSAATLPVTLECLLKKVGVSNRVASFVLPIGTTLNMDGTALYQVSAAIFLAQVYDIQLAFWHYAIIGLTAIFASIGAAGLPSTGLFTLVIILNSVNIPLEGIGLILGVDRILDMCRSMVNVWGNACSTVVVAKLEGERF